MTDYKMPIGSVSFRYLREQNEYYVDKTGLISELLTENTARTAVITRPRRFGKTLNITMLRDFFDCTKNSRELFAGLAISKDSALCDKWMNQYPVLYLPLNTIKNSTFDGVVRRFAAFASRLCQEHSAVLECKDVPEQTKRALTAILERTADTEDLLDLLLHLSKALFALYQKKPVILIDEYDAPFSLLTTQDDQIKLAEFMGGLFETGLKTNEYFEFAVLTGCLRITKENIFTGLNNLSVMAFQMLYLPTNSALHLMR
ncbi:MAG: AAA family ATPase [Desulfovibrionaceae bacterium]|nr:AAA family ATPase [Desulfovibrionaceae bacterium]